MVLQPPLLYRELPLQDSEWESELPKDVKVMPVKVYRQYGHIFYDTYYLCEKGSGHLTNPFSMLLPSSISFMVSDIMPTIRYSPVYGFTKINISQITIDNPKLKNH